MAARRRLRFGVHCVHEGGSFAELQAFWRHVEALGYDWISLIDHLFPVWAPLEAPIWETGTALAALAASTQRVRISTLTLCNNFRHPSVLAKAWATIDHISNGRLELGIGAGWNAAEHAAYGLEYPAPGERVRRLDEALHVIKALWKEPRANFEGRYYTVRDAYCEPKPLQQPYPPIVVGGGGEKLMLKVIARHADVWNVGSHYEPEVYRRKSEILDRNCEAIGRDPAEIGRSWAVLTVCAETDAKAQDLARRLETYLIQPLRPSQSLIGGPETCAERILEFVHMGVTDIIVRTLPWPLGPQLVENFMNLVVPRIQEGAKI
jgi:F420-dependent oxidoreductase-like protein